MVPAGSAAGGKTPLSATPTEAGYCVANAADTTGQTVDCYLTYSSTTTLRWNLVGNTDPNDYDDPGGVDPGGNNLICGGAPIVSMVTGANPAAVTVTATPVQPLPQCPSNGGTAIPSAPLSMTITTSADSTAGPFTDTIAFNAPAMWWDPSDNGGEATSANFIAIVHVGPCSNSAPSGASVARVASHTPVHGAPQKKATSHQRGPKTVVGPPVILVYGLPVFDGAPVACTIAPAPTPVPIPVPPPPAVPKATYTASLFAKAVIPLTDAAPPAFGTLTWVVTGDTVKFPGFSFSTPTTVSPHADNLRFTVPPTLAPGDYILRFHVTSSTFGTTSPDTVVTLRVLNPAYLEMNDNSINVYELNRVGQLMTSDDGYGTNDDGTTPDFGLDSTKNPASTSRAVSAAIRGSFNPLAPPQQVLNKILFLESENKISCESVLVIDNTAHDPGSGAAPAIIRGYGYCRPLGTMAYSPTVSYLAEAFNIANATLSATSGKLSEPASEPVKYTGAPGRFA